MTDSSPSSVLDRSGLVVVDKPAGMTSHDVVARLRRFLGTRKVGHSGTLDPMATGVLVLGVERGTKFLAHVVTHDKRYDATVCFGASTVTDDCEGEVLVQAEPERVRAVTRQEIVSALEAYRGRIMQRPAAVSSIKVDGRRAHELVREGKHVELPARPVEIFALEVGDVWLEEAPHGPRWMARISVHCSSGTYIRSVARDAGADLGLGGHLTQLRRTSVGPFVLDEAVALAELAERPRLQLSLDEAMVRCFPTRWISEREAEDVALGKWLVPEGRSGVYAVATGSADAPRAVALLQEKGKRAASVFVARPAGLD